MPYSTRITTSHSLPFIHKKLEKEEEIHDRLGLTRGVRLWGVDIVCIFHNYGKWDCLLNLQSAMIMVTWILGIHKKPLF